MTRTQVRVGGVLKGALRWVSDWVGGMYESGAGGSGGVAGQSSLLAERSQATVRPAGMREMDWTRAEWRAEKMAREASEGKRDNRGLL